MGFLLLNSRGYFCANCKFLATSVAGSEDEAAEDIPNVFILEQNYPNPFNPSTTISYTLPKSGNVQLIVYDILGREAATLVNEEKAPGNYKVVFNAEGLPSGIYFYRLTAGDFSISKTMMFLK